MIKKLLIFIFLLFIYVNCYAASVHLITPAGEEYPGDSTYGLDVDITRMPSDDPNTPTYISLKDGGTYRYSIKYEAVDPNTSITLVFTDPNNITFESSIVQILTSQSNNEDVVIDWHGGTAVKPAANTAGDAMYPPGCALSIRIHTSAISVKSAGAALSGDQTISVYAFQ